MREFTPGDVFADHRIDALAGRGGMGVVYRATQLGLERTVALKVINPVLADDDDFRRRFVAESKAAASVEHPNVLPVHYAGEHEGVLFIVMRYVDGPDLRALVRAEGRLGAERTAHVVAQVGGALDAAHRHGLVHRDVKPANVLLGEDDHAYLTDFGLTKQLTLSADGGLSRTGAWVGTLGYAAPEQIRGERVDARTDVYALGCVLVHALTGNPPYVRDSDHATMWAHLNASPPTKDVPPEFTGLVKRALAKDPADRYPSAGDLGRAALVAAGNSPLPGRERIVARGGAAPPDEAETPVIAPGGGATRPDAETNPSPIADDETVAAETVRDARPAATPAHRRGAAVPRRGAIVAGVCALAAAAVLAVLVLPGSGDDDTPAKTTAGATPGGDAGRRASVAGKPMHGVESPLSLTSTGGTVWVGGRSRSLALYDAGTGVRVQTRPDVGTGAHVVATGPGSVWVLNATTNELLRVDAKTGRRAANAPGRIATTGQALVLAAGDGAVWAGVRAASARDDYVLRVDAGDGGRRAIPVPGGVQDLAISGRTLWVTNRAASTVTRISTSTLQATKVIPVGDNPKGVAIGSGAVWVASAGDDALTRIDLGDLKTSEIALKATPDRVAVGGGAVWVTSRAAGRLLRIDTKTRRLRESIATGYDPYALDVVGGDRVWIGLVRENAVQRVRFSK